MRARRRGWIMPREQHRSALIRLRAILEEDLEDQAGDPAPQVSAVTADTKEPDQRPGNQTRARRASEESDVARRGHGRR
jgi:hypothetical protein